MTDLAKKLGGMKKAELAEMLADVLGKVGGITETTAKPVDDDEPATVEVDLTDDDDEPKEQASTSTTKKRKSKYQYGTAPCEFYKNGIPNAPATHKARVAALEKAVPGIGKRAMIYSIGKDGNGKLTKNMKLAENVPFTYIAFGTKPRRIGKLKWDEVAKRLAALGFGFSNQSDGKQKIPVWMTSSKGEPPKAYKGYRRQNVGAAVASAMIGSSDD